MAQSDLRDAKTGQRLIGFDTRHVQRALVEARSLGIFVVAQERATGGDNGSQRSAAGIRITFECRKIGTVGGDGQSDDESALALGRVSVVADELVARGIDADRVVTSVAPPAVVSSPSSSLPAGSEGVPAGEVGLRIENLLVFGPGG